MRAIFLICLVIVAISSSPCMGGTVLGNSTASLAGTNPSPLSPSVPSKITRVGMLCPTENEAARQQYNNALELQQEGRLRDAREAYQKAVEQDSRYCDAMDNLGQMLRTEGDVKQAIYWYERSLAVKPDNAVAHQNLAVAYNVQGDQNKSQSEYLWLIKNDSTNPEGYYGLGAILLGSGQTDAAIEKLALAEKIYRENGSSLAMDAQYLLGVAYFNKQDYKRSREYLALSYAQKQDDPNVNYLLGLCYLDPSTGDKKQASEFLLKAGKLGVQVPPDVLQQLGK
ncbi:tetratricopeptide repeat protein [Geotalea uraniireducens]|nr:tetratricopeptide repeat protein [Geotalea uraniireducens]